ncbi:hypothetical protein KP509_06G069400 [Ceratopteris richardii]|nr:hypothetical protein KP509_06G069400 [Ceratopteris richardii]
MASPKTHSFILHGTLYLPLICLAVLTGFLLSFILSISLTSLLSDMKSTIFIIVPTICYGFSKLITPPCLFVLLNGIIVVLTASSGILSSSCSADDFDSYADPLHNRKERSQSQKSGDSKPDFPVSISHGGLSEKMESFSAPGKIIAASVRNIRKHYAVLEEEDGRFHAVQEEKEKEKNAVEDDREEGIDELREKPKEDVNKFSRLSVESRSFSFSCAESKKFEEDEVADRKSVDDDGFATYLKPNGMERKPSFPRRPERRRHRGHTSSNRSVLANSKVITRSLSVDSASLQNESQGSSAMPSVESLSDEAFRRRVEDFISRMNAQMRNEM